VQQSFVLALPLAAHSDLQADLFVAVPRAGPWQA
jgi:hypothetical protein